AYLTDAGLDEAVTYSFTDPTPMPPFLQDNSPIHNEATVMQNPISTKEATLRVALLPSLLQAAKRNVAHGNNDFGLYEIARVYQPNGAEVSELPTLAGVMVGNPGRNWRNPKA